MSGKRSENGNGAAAFCSCGDLSCPFHPSNHDQGCTPCIRKHLKLHEIPSCFFNEIGSASDHSVFSFEEFAETVLADIQDPDT